MRLMDHEVLTFCADDAHGAPIMMKADELGIEPTAFIDEINKNHQESLTKFGIEYTNYYSTHSKENEALVSEIYLDAKSSGYIYKKEIEQCFDEEKQIFLADRYVVGECPNVQQRISMEMGAKNVELPTLLQSLSILNHHYLVPRQ